MGISEQLTRELSCPLGSAASVDIALSGAMIRRPMTSGAHFKWLEPCKGCTGYRRIHPKARNPARRRRREIERGSGKLNLLDHVCALS